eukprot:1068510-Rhodomonas_salina.2
MGGVAAYPLYGLRRLRAEEHTRICSECSKNGAKAPRDTVNWYNGRLRARRTSAVASGTGLYCGRVVRKRKDQALKLKLDDEFHERFREVKNNLKP